MEVENKEWFTIKSWNGVASWAYKNACDKCATC